MFTESTIPLSSFAGTMGMNVIRNCDFSYVGKIPTPLNRRIVPASSEANVHLAVLEKGIAGIITTKSLASLVPLEMGLAISDTPMQSTLKLQNHLALLRDFQWKSFRSKIHPSVTVHSNAYVAPDDVVINEGSIIYPGSIILPRTVIGKFCTIGPGTIVSTNAFEIDTSSDEMYSIVKQSGGVRLGDYVDIQAKCTIVRSTFGGFTEIGDGTKFDCQVHFAHDCKAGRNVVIAACAEVSGRVSIGDYSFIGPNASISNGLKIGENAKVSIGSVVTRDVNDGETVSGNFAVRHDLWIDFVKSVNK